MPQKLPIVTRWATNRVQLPNGYYNRLNNEPQQSFLDNGFVDDPLPRQLLNYLFYNHGENLTYSVYYTNRPFIAATKNDLPSAGDNPGVIYHVASEGKLVLSVDSKWIIIATLGAEI